MKRQKIQVGIAGQTVTPRKRLRVAEKCLKSSFKKLVDVLKHMIYSTEQDLFYITFNI